MSNFKSSMIDIELPQSPPPVTKVCWFDKPKEKPLEERRRRVKNIPHRLYRHGLPRPRGVHDYHNLNWDPCIYRGRTFKDFREKNFPPYTSTVNFYNYCCTDRKRHAELVHIHRKHKSVVPRIKVGGIIRPTTDDVVIEATGSRRHKQDEFYNEIEPFVIEQSIPPLYKDMGTESDERNPKVPRKCSSVAAGKSVSTFANICVCGTKEYQDPIQPIIDILGSKVLEQSMIETVEEDQIRRIRVELSEHMERRRIRQAQQMKRVEAELFKAEQEIRERARRERELAEELEVTESVEAITFSFVICHDVLFDTFEQLRTSKYLVEPGEMVMNHFNVLLEKPVGDNIFLPRRVLDDIIQRVEKEKMVDYAAITAAQLLHDQIEHEEKQKENALIESAKSKTNQSEYDNTPAPPTSTNLTSEEEGEGEEEEETRESFIKDRTRSSEDGSAMSGHVTFN